MARVFESRREGTCALCTKGIKVGERITKDRNSGKYAHADCVWPDRVKGGGNATALSGNISTSGGSSSPSEEYNLAYGERISPTPTLEESVEDKVAANMDFGIKLTAEKLVTSIDEIKTRPEYLAFAVEAARQRHSMLTMEYIQRNKQRNIQSVNR